MALQQQVTQENGPYLGRLDVRGADVQARLVDVYTWRFMKDVWCMLLISPVAENNVMITDTSWYLCQFYHLTASSLKYPVDHQDASALHCLETLHITIKISRALAILRQLKEQHGILLQTSSLFSHWWGWVLRRVQYLPKAMLGSCRIHPSAIALATIIETSVRGMYTIGNEVSMLRQNPFTVDPFSIKLAMYIQVCLVVYHSIRRTQLGYPNSSVKAPLRPRKINATTKIPPVTSHECHTLAALPNTTSKDCTHGCDQDRNLSKDCRLIKLWSSFHHESMKMQFQFQWAPMPSYDAARLRCPVVRTSGLWQRLLACSNWATELNSLGKCQFRMVKICKNHENSIRLFFGLVLLASRSQTIPSEHHKV